LFDEKTGGQKFSWHCLFKNDLKEVICAGVISGRWGTGHASIVPYQTFQTQDGYLTIACGSNAHFR
jgi:crotonobetainyl-CoA:carnitine CoA-transferase CaiB-like acyl-CoA transferase